MEKITQKQARLFDCDLSKYKYIEVCTQNGKSEAHNLKNKYFSLWNDEKIKLAFNFGNGTEADFLRYAKDNKNFAKFYKIK